MDDILLTVKLNEASQKDLAVVLDHNRLDKGKGRSQAIRLALANEARRIKERARAIAEVEAALNA